MGEMETKPANKMQLEGHYYKTDRKASKFLNL